LVGGLCHEHVVDGEPDLTFQLCDSTLLVRLNLGPFIVFKFLLNSFSVGSDPWSELEQGHEHKWDVVVLHQLMNDRSGETFHMVCNEPDQTEAGHRATELNVGILAIEIFDRVHLK